MPKKKKSTDKLVMLCASHLHNMQRLKYLEEMLLSWAKQTHPIPLYLRISTDIGLKYDFEDLAKKWTDKYPEQLFIFYTDKKASQFHHYKWLANQLKDYWCIFTDDDDLSHPDRAKVYAQAIEDNPNAMYIDIPKSYQNNANKMDDVPDPEKFSDGVTYWAYCCKIASLRDFCNKCSDTLLNFYMCDKLFTRYLGSHKDQGVVIKDKSDNWMYYWRGADNPNLRNTNLNYVKQGHYREIIKADEWYAEKFDIEKDYALISTAMNNIVVFFTRCGVKGSIDYVADELKKMCVDWLKEELHPIDRGAVIKIFHRFIRSDLIKAINEAPHVVPADVEERAKKAEKKIVNDLD